MAKIESIQEVAVDDLVPYLNNAKQHGAEQVDLIARSIEEFGFLNPILIDADKNIIAGHGRLMAAKQIGLETVPCINVEGLSEAQYKAYVLADNRLTELGEWNMDLVNEELKALQDLDFDISLTGFELNEEDVFENIDTDGLGTVKSTEHHFSIDDKKYAITDEEYELLTERFEAYLQENGITYGFILEAFKDD